MDQRELDYVDMRDPQARSQYINDAPEPQRGEPLPEEHQTVIAVPLPPRPHRGRPRKTDTGETETYAFFKVSVAQKALFSTPFVPNGDSQTLEWYASQCGIPLSNAKKLLCKLRRGESILPKDHYKRKSRVIPFQHLILRRLTIDPTTSL